MVGMDYKGREYICIATQNGCVYIYDAAQESLAASVRLSQSGEDYEQLIASERLCTYKTKLLWRSNNELGFVSLDFDEIDFSKAPDESQFIKPRLVMASTKGYVVAARPLIVGDMMYYVEKKKFKETEGLIHAMNLATGEREAPLKPGCYGQTIYGVLLCGDMLVVLDSYGLLGIDTIEWKIAYWIADSKVSTLSGDAYGYGGFYYKDRLYYTNTCSSNTDKNHHLTPGTAKNILCVDPKTGKLLWGDMPPMSGSLGGRPIACNNKLYVGTPSGLRVYDTLRERLIGVDKTVLMTQSTHLLLDTTLYVFRGKGQQFYLSAISVR